MVKKTDFFNVRKTQNFLQLFFGYVLLNYTLATETDLITLRMEIVRACRAIISKELVEIGRVISPPESQTLMKFWSLPRIITMKI